MIQRIALRDYLVFLSVTWRKIKFDPQSWLIILESSIRILLAIALWSLNYTKRCFEEDISLFNSACCCWYKLLLGRWYAYSPQINFWKDLLISKGFIIIIDCLNWLEFYSLRKSSSLHRVLLLLNGRRWFLSVLDLYTSLCYEESEMGFSELLNVKIRDSSFRISSELVLILSVFISEIRVAVHNQHLISLSFIHK